MASPIEFDDYASPRFHAGHAAIDQYQWYSLELDDWVQTTAERSGEPAFWDVITGLFPVSAELVAFGDGIGGDFVRSYYYLNNDEGFLIGGFQLWGLPSPNGPYYQYIKFYPTFRSSRRLENNYRSGSRRR